MTFSPTPEQAAIVEAAQGSSDNLIISALAGAAKTSTLVLIAQALPSTRILCLAFNKRIAVEMQERLPKNCTAMTLNSLGHRTWAETINRRLTLDAGKNYTILTELVKALPKAQQDDAYETFADTLKIIEQGKVSGYVPDGAFPATKRLLTDDEFFSSLDEEPSDLTIDLIRRASKLSIRQGLDGKIDFNDQILLPTVFPAMFEHYPLVLVDEAQDLSALNHATLRKLAKKRLIAVGDECQSIYGFRGAHENSMHVLQETFSMRKLVLSVSFRCPRAVVEAARWRAPHMQYPEWAKPGLVRNVQDWDQTLIPSEAAIVCRNNAPLFGMAIKLLKNGRRPEIVGNDIGKYLVKVMKKFGDPGMSQDEAITALNTWANEKRKKARDRAIAKINDQEACIRVFLEQGETLREGIAYAEHLFATQGPIQMMTGHKSKGLEFDNVFILDRDLIRMDEPQDRNLFYVMQTRAKKELTYVQSDYFIDEVELARQADGGTADGGGARRPLTQQDVERARI